MPINPIRLSLKEYDRNTTKSEYKVIQNWLRRVARLIGPKVLEQAEQATYDLTMYGTAITCQ